MSTIGARVLPVQVNPTKIAAGGEGWTGVNKPVKATTLEGETVVLKHNDVGGFGAFSKMIPESAKRMLDVKEIVLSHISHDNFGLPGATYREGYVIDASTGKRSDGIICNWIEGIGTLRDTPVTAIKDGDLAVKENIVKGGLMGDPDTTKPKSSNVWVVKSSGQPVNGDFGNSGQRGITTLGVPRANQQVMWSFARPDNVDPIVNQIRNLSDADIKGMVDAAGSKYIHDWSPKMSADITKTLVGNRDRLRKHNVFAHYYKGFHPMLSPTMTSVVTPALTYAWYAQQGMSLLKQVAAAKLKELVGHGE